MGRRKTKKASLPPVVVTIRQGQTSMAQKAAYQALWDKLLAPKDGKPPVVSGGPSDGGDDGNHEEASDGRE